jgi:hypothetical protein
MAAPVALPEAFLKFFLDILSGGNPFEEVHFSLNRPWSLQPSSETMTSSDRGRRESVGKHPQQRPGALPKARSSRSS